MAVSLDSLLSSEACNGFYKLGAVHHAGEPVGYVRIGDDMLVAAGIFEFPMHVSFCTVDRSHRLKSERMQNNGTPMIVLASATADDLLTAPNAHRTIGQLDRFRVHMESTHLLQSANTTSRNDASHHHQDETASNCRIAMAVPTLLLRPQLGMAAVSAPRV